MKKRLFILCMIALVAFSFIGCDNNTAEPTGPVPATPEETAIVAKIWAARDEAVIPVLDENGNPCIDPETREYIYKDGVVLSDRYEGEEKVFEFTNVDVFGDGILLNGTYVPYSSGWLTYGENTINWDLRNCTEPQKTPVKLNSKDIIINDQDLNNN